MKLSLRTLPVLAFAVLCSSTIPGQVLGKTENVQVRMVTESWAATATNGSFAVGRSTVVPAPAHWPKPVSPPVGSTIRSNEMSATSAAQAAAGQSSLIGIVFPGPSDGVPPDSQVAAGPNHLVGVVNSRIEIFSKSGAPLSISGENMFFQSVGNCGCFDSRVLYDQADQRFIISTSKRDSSTTSAMLVAVSQTSDPTGNWNKFEIAPSTTSWYDFPTLGLSSAAIYISPDVIPNNPGLAHFDLFVIGLPELLAGSSNLNITRFENVASRGSLLGAITYGNSPTEFFMETGDPGTVLHMFKVNTSGTPMLTKTDITVPFYTFPTGFVQQPGDSTHLVSGSNDIGNVVWRNGSLWCAHSVRSDDGQSTVVRWYEIDTATETLKQSGTVSGAGNATYPAITITPDGSATLVYTTSSSTQFASAGYAHRNASDPPGAMPVSGIYQAGTVTYLVIRWGDYSGISADPDGNSAWGIAEIAQTSNTTTTAIAQILNASQPPANGDFTLSASPGSTTVKQGQSASYMITVTPQNGFQGPVAFSCVGLPANTTCAFNPATVSVSAAAQSQLTIATTASKTALGLRSIVFYAVMVPLTTLLWTGLRRKKITRVLMMIMILALAVGFHTGCAGTSTHSNAPNPTPMPTPTPSPTPTPPGTSGGTPLGAHMVTVVGTSGSLQRSVTVQIVVQ